MRMHVPRNGRTLEESVGFPMNVGQRDEPLLPKSQTQM